MKLTNKLGLPAALVAAVQRWADKYNKGDADFSATGLLRPPLMSRLQRDHRDEITEDVIDRLYALQGQVVHAILTSLKEAGLVRAIRGARGGFIVARPPSEITVGEICEALEGKLAVVDCVADRSVCSRVDTCRTWGMWKRLNDAMVEVEFERPAGAVSRTFRGFSSIPPALQQYVELGRNSKFILRRKQLLDFILAQPAPRYQQLAAIIGIGDLDKVERTLMRARDDLLSEKETLERQIQEEEAKLNDLLGAKVVTDRQILAAVNRKLAELE